MDVDGNVSGSWQSNYNDANDDFDINTHGTIECVTFVGNKMATMAGTITHANTGAYWDPFELEINDKAYFEVIDNGEGKHGTPDQFSDLFVGLNQSRNVGTSCILHTSYTEHDFHSSICSNGTPL